MIGIATGRTPLHIASALVEYSADMAMFLYSCGADIGAVDAAGNTALHFAAAAAGIASPQPVGVVDVDGASPSCVIALLQAGAAVDVANSRGQTPLHIAAGNGAEHAVAALLQYGASLWHRCAC